LRILVGAETEKAIGTVVWPATWPAR